MTLPLQSGLVHNNVSNEAGVFTIHLYTWCSKVKKPNKMKCQTPAVFLWVGKAACLPMPSVCSSSTSLPWQVLGHQGTVVNYFQPHTSAMLLQDLKLETAKSDQCLDGTGPRMQFRPWGSPI